MLNTIKRISVFLLIISLTVGCKTDTKTSIKDTTPIPVNKRKVPKFVEQNAYNFIQKQVDFGPRYPGIPAHRATVDYLVAELEKVTDKVYRQEFEVDFLDVKNAAATNIIGTINPKLTKRILLGAHFDTRKIAEKDENPEKQNNPILGADDGASGIGVLLEIARLINLNGIDIGVDFIFFDAEDNGKDNENWCLGSEYWGKNPHIKNYKADFGILLDLVGAKNAEFGKEEYSVRNAGKYVDKVWTLAHRMGFDNYFHNVSSGGVMDDHINVMKYRKIPMINIINMSQQNGRNGFDHYHHTHKDNMDIIDTNTLRAVGKVVLAAVYNYSNGTL